MNKSQRYFSQELEVATCENGIVLSRLSSNQVQGVQLESYMNQSHCVYFNDAQCAISKVNEAGQKALGFLSNHDAIGNSLLDVFLKEVALKVIHVQKQVMLTKQPQIIEEDVLRKDGESFQCLSILMPWYSEESKIIGVAGMSIIPGKHSMTTAIQAISSYGLLTPSVPLLPKRVDPKNAVYISSREMQILKCMLKGNTAKETAKSLFLSPRTVEHHIENMKIKMKVNTKSELIVKAMAYLQV